MDYKELVEGIKHYGSTSEDIVKSGFKVDAEQIKENVIISPTWTPMDLSFNANVECFNKNVGSVERLNGSIGSAARVYNIAFDNHEATYITTGVGAPIMADIVLQLGLTKCKRILLIGSVGAIDDKLNIGDILIPDYAISGDGVCRYLTGDFHDVFGQKEYPDGKLLGDIYNISKKICGEEDIKFHRANLFTVTSLFAQFVYIEQLKKYGSRALDMEAAAAFCAANVAGIPIAGIFQIFNNVVENKSMYSRITREEIDYRDQVRKLIFPKIILATLRKFNEIN